MTLGKKLKKLRKERHLTQQQVADALGFSRSIYSQYERDEREPSTKRLISLARFYRVSIDYLCDNSDRYFVDITDMDIQDKNLIIRISYKYYR